jgi:hypothetical protein
MIRFIASRNEKQNIIGVIPIAIGTINRGVSVPSSVLGPEKQRK